MGLMSIFFHGKKVPVRENFRKPLAWTVLVLALAASFAAGRLTAREDAAVPIVIEQQANVE